MVRENRYGEAKKLFVSDIASLATTATSKRSQVINVPTGMDTLGVALKATVGVGEVGKSLICRVYTRGKNGNWSTRFREVILPLENTGDIVTAVIPVYVLGASQIQCTFYNQGVNAVTAINGWVEI